MRSTKNSRIILWLVVAAALGAVLLSACSSGDQSSAAAVSSEKAITQAIRDYLDEQGAPISRMEVQVKQIEGDYARVEIISADPESPGGFNAFMKREDGAWTTLVAGSGMEREHVEALGIPESVWPEGWISSSTNCPAPSSDTLLRVDEAGGYCLLYPASHTVEELDSGNTEIVVGSVLNHIDPRVGITIEDLAGRSLEQVVDGFLAGYPGFEIERSQLTLAGEEAVLLDGVPGQDFYRKLFVAHGGSLYQLDVFPYDPNLVDTLPQAERLYALLIDSFQFLTP